MSGKDGEWERAEVSCPSCLELLVLRPGMTEIWCGRCEIGYEISEAKHPRDPKRSVLVLEKKRGER